MGGDADFLKAGSFVRRYVKSGLSLSFGIFKDFFACSGPYGVYVGLYGSKA